MTSIFARKRFESVVFFRVMRYIFSFKMTIFDIKSTANSYADCTSNTSAQYIQCVTFSTIKT